MSSRTVSVVLSAQVANYLSNMRAAEAQTLALERSTRSATQQFAAHNEALTKVGVGMLAVGATAAAGIALVVKASAEFGAKMAQLQSLAHANEATMKQAASAAMSLGTAYGFSATQVADAQIELQKAGIGITQQLGGALKGALALAAAGQLDLGQATEITTVAMTQFGLSAKDVPHLADLLAAGADKALGSVGDLGEGLKNGGLQAHNMGLSIEDTVGLLSAFANAGILGAEAGTQMRSMFLRLQNPTKESREVLEKYGIAINDTSGKFVGITKFAGELQDRLGKLDPATRNAALATVFGSHAIVGATVLYQDGAKGIGDWVVKVNDSGFAAAQAAGKMDSLAGDAQKLAAVFQTDLIKAGSGANDGLRALVKTGTNVLTVFGNIPAPIQEVAVTGTALVAVVGLVGGGFLVAVPKIVAFRTALAALNLTMKGTLASAGLIGGAVAGIALLISGQQASEEKGIANTKQITAAAEALQDRLKNVNSLFKGNALVGAGIKNAFEQELSGEAADNKGLDGLLGNMTKIGDVYRNHEGAFSALGSQLAGLSKVNYAASAQGFATLAKQVGATGDAAKQMKLVDLLANGSAYKQQLESIAKGIGVQANAQNLLAIANNKGAIGQRALVFTQQQAATTAAKQADQLASLAGQATSATTSIDSLQSAIEGFGSAQLDARSATRAMYQAIDDATAAAKTNGRTLDVHTEKGRANAAALDGIASAADQAASKTLKQTGSVQKAQAVLQTGRDAFIRTAMAMGKSSTEAERLADKLELIPKNITTAVGVTGVDLAKTRLQDLQTKLDDLQGKKITVRVAAQLDALNSAIRVASMEANGVDYYGNPVKKATGGQIDGPGPRGVDSVHAILAPGEHVLTTRDVAALGGQGGVYAFRRQLEQGVPRFAKGGAVSAIGDQQLAAMSAAQDVTDFTRLLRTAKREQTAAQKEYERISGKEADRDAKRAAKDQADAASKRADSLQKRLDAAKEARDTARSAITALQQGAEDFTSTQTRATDDSPIDPLSYVDQLRSMSRDSNYSSTRRKAFDTAANGAEASLVKLQTSSAKAAQNLTDLRTASQQMRDQITQSIAGGYSLAGGVGAAGSQTNTGDWFTRDGIAYQQSTTGGAVTAAGLAGYFAAGATNSDQFATALQALANRGVSSALLAQLAGMGTQEGLPIAQAILNGSDADIAGLNQGFGALQVQAGRAGSIVADTAYAAQIAAADANAQQITDEIATQGDALRKLIAKAFGIPGYASGTRSAAPGIRWVGEHGPELAGFQGGEAVLNAPSSARWIRGAAGAAAAPQVTVQPTPARFPDTITVQDLHGFTATMRVVATQEIAKDAAHDAVMMLGSATV